MVKLAVPFAFLLALASASAWPGNALSPLHRRGRSGAGVSPRDRLKLCKAGGRSAWVPAKLKAHQGESSAAGAVSRRGFFRPVASLLVVSSISAIALEFYSRVNVFSASALQLSSGSKLLRWIGGLRDAKNLPALSGDGGPKDWDGAAVVFHGAGGPDGFTEALMERLNDTRKGGGKKQPNFFYDWSAYSTNLFKAAFNGQAVGRHVGRELFDGLTNGKSDVAVKREVHVIGISVGAFAADMAAKELRALLRRNNVDDVTIQLTLLDPFTQRGVFGVGWGLKNFGKDGPDYAQQFMNTDDPGEFFFFCFFALFLKFWKFESRREGRVREFLSFLAPFLPCFSSLILSPAADCRLTSTYISFFPFSSVNERPLPKLLRLRRDVVLGAKLRRK